MRATTLHAAGDIRVDNVPDPALITPMDAIVSVTAGAICGSDLWRYRGETEFEPGQTMGHECLGVVVEVGPGVHRFAPRDSVLVPFNHCDGTCVNCVAGFPASCVDRQSTKSGQAELARVAHADATLISIEPPATTQETRSLLALTDVMPTGWHAAMSAGVKPGSKVAVIGDGAVGLCAILAAATLGAEQIIAAAATPARQEMARRFGATSIVATRGREAVEEIRDLTGGFGATATLECVGSQEAVSTAVQATRPGGAIGAVGVPHGVEIPALSLYYKNITLAGGITPIQRHLPELLEMVISGALDPGPIFDLTLNLDQAAEGYKAMAEQRAIKVLLRP